MDPRRNFLFAMVAIDTGRLTPAQLQDFGRQAAVDADASLPDHLIAAGRLTERERDEIAARVEEVLAAGVQTTLTPRTPAGPEESPVRVLAGEPVEAETVPPQATPRPVAGTVANPTAATEAVGGGVYERLRVHGQGGIGRVWLARDGRLQRDVALKELRPEAAGFPPARQRFLAEAQITGRLEHPGIVPVYDLAAGDGRQTPFYVMRFVRGRTLTEATGEYHARRRRRQATAVELAHLLQAFVAVCNAVGYAHSRGVIHRDLKGSNVLLGDFGQVIVLDWGLAKEVGERRPEDSGQPSADRGPAAGPAGQTLQGEVLGTLAYMSPEQAAGDVDRVNERSDIYGLGAVLYELLTGRPPFSLTPDGAGGKQLTVAELLERIRTEPPPRPRSIAPDVPPALEAVCLKALARSPADRYGSAVELADDVQRWLADEPVSVYRDPLPVRLGRWARRHRTSVAALAVLLVVGLVALAVSNYLLGRERERTAAAAARAERNFARARGAVDRFYVQVSENRLLNEPGFQDLRRELLATAWKYYEELRGEQAGEAGLELDLARTLYQLAGVTRDLGDTGASLEHLHHALGLLEGGPAGATAAGRLLSAKCLARRGQCLHLRGDLDAAAGAYRAALREVTGPGDEPRRLEGDVVGNLGLVYQALAGEGTRAEREAWLDRAEESLAESLRLHRALADAHPDDDRLRDELAGSLTNLAQLVRFRDLPQAQQHMVEALAIHEGLVGRHPESLAYRDNLGKSCNTLAALYNTDPKAEPLFQRALGIRAGLTAANPNVASFREELGNVHLNMGTYCYRVAASAPAADRPQLTRQSADHFEQAHAAYARLRKDFPREGRYAFDHALALTSLGNVWYDADPDAALGWYREAVAAFRSAPKLPQAGEPARALATAHWGLAELYANRRDWGEALAAWHAAAGLRDAVDDGTWDQIRAGLTRTLAAARAAGHFQAAEASAALARLLALPALRGVQELEPFRTLSPPPGD